MKLSYSLFVTTFIHFGKGKNNFGIQAAALDDLPWEQLKDKLTSSSVLYDTKISDYADQCLPVFDNPYAVENRSNHFLIEKESGLCLPHFFCAFAGCNPAADNTSMTFVDTLITYFALYMGQDYPYPESPYNIPSLSEAIDPSNPSYNLPYKVLFPQVPGDVVAAVDFANEHKIEISVKNSGHSYAGSSTRKNTLMINTNHYKQYSSTSAGIIECNADVLLEGQAAISQDLSNQPCIVASSRGKPAVVHIGTGENFDKVLRSVKTWNQENLTPEGDYKLHMVSGAAGTVTSFGWTFQGGLPGTAAGRLFGPGVDQVVQLEMVLPTGEHVRFGPTSWEVEEGYLQPKTTKVSGVCNESPYEEDESKWVWSACDEEINFDDLWFAQLGGGGGTWGVVLSMHVQLHDWPGHVDIRNYGGCDRESVPLKLALNRFLIDFLLDPEEIGLTQEQSFRCTANDDSILICHGDGSGDDLTNAWKNYIDSRTQELVEAGVPEQSVTDFKECAFKEGEIKYPDWAELITNPGFPVGHPFEGRAIDLPAPGYAPDTFPAVNALIPAKWVLENKEAAADLIVASGGSPYIAHSSGQSTSDQANAFSESHREAAFMLFFGEAQFDEGLADQLSLPHVPFFSELLPQMYDTTDEKKFPSYVGSNHLGPGTFGPLKSDWTKVCPYDWTHQERNEKCISAQETVWGTELLERLEAIKETVDPNHIFDCFRCVGNDGGYDLLSGESIDGETSEPTEVIDTTEPTVAPQPSSQPTTKQPGVDPVPTPEPSSSSFHNGGMASSLSSLGVAATAFLLLFV